MTREIDVITPENTTISYELGGLGSRAVAFLLDTLIQAGVLLAVFLIFAFSAPAFLRFDAKGNMMNPVFDVWTALYVLVTYLVIWGYYIFFESRWNGQTPGKRVMGLRVIREEGAPIDFTCVIVRNLVRLLEMYALQFLCVISVLVSPKYKRLGDYAAGTIVVKERTPSSGTPQVKKIYVNPNTTVEASYVREVELLSKEELATLRRFVERRWELDVNTQEVVAKQIAAPIIARLRITPIGGGFSYANFLEEMFKKCIEERGTL